MTVLLKYRLEAVYGLSTVVSLKHCILQSLQYYRDKIRAEVEGRSYVPPAPSAANNSSLSRPPAGANSRGVRVGGNSSNDSWDDWGAKPSTVKVYIA